MSHSSPIVLEAHGLSKKYCRQLKRSFVYGARDIARELSGRPAGPLRKGEFWALRDVSFQLKAGSALGLIGQNGGGKTTLLKLLSGIIKPSTGYAVARGKIAPLIALGAGFNPVLSGRENIFVNLSLLGLSMRQIESRVDDILEFSEIGEAIDAPIRTYSSGMAARLGFACAIHAIPEILLVDEVLAVGDARFRVKCYRKLTELRNAGAAIIMVSHSANSILATCETALYLRKGEVAFHGPTSEALSLYQSDQDAIDAPGELKEKAALPAMAHDKAISEVFFTDGNGGRMRDLACGQPATLNVKFKSSVPMDKLILTVIVRKRSVDQSDVLSLSSARDGEFFRCDKGESTLKLAMPQVGLKAGKYLAKISVSEGEPYNFLSILENVVFSVEPDLSIGSSAYYQTRKWLNDDAIV